MFAADNSEKFEAEVVGFLIDAIHFNVQMAKASAKDYRLLMFVVAFFHLAAVSYMDSQIWAHLSADRTPGQCDEKVPQACSNGFVLELLLGIALLFLPH